MNDLYSSILSKKYQSKIISKTIQAINKYDLIKKGDKIAVCISGGKDSFIMAKVLNMIQSFYKYNFEIKNIVMDPGYSKEDLSLIQNNLDLLNLKADIFKTEIFSVVNKVDSTPCALCARMRRGALYDFAKKISCNKIALAHHFDDVIETTLMNMFNNGLIQTMLPKIKATNIADMELIRPFYFVREKDIISYQKETNLKFLNCACPFTQSVEYNKEVSKRKQTKELIHELLKYNKNIEKNIFNSVDNITLDMILGYKDKGIYHSYYDDYNSED